MKIPKTYLTICLLVLLGLVMRLPELHEGFWRDETHVYYVASASKFAVLIARLIPVEFNPPVFYVLMHYWQMLVGGGEVGMKIPALLFGLALIPVVYLLGKQVAGSTVGILAAALVTFSPQAVFFSLQCRAYSLAALVDCIIVLLYCRILAKNINLKYQIALSLCLLLTLYNHYTGLLLLLSLGVATIVLWLRGERKLSLYRWAIILLLPLLGFLPWLKIIMEHVHTGFHWTQNPLWYEWIRVFIVNLLLASPVSFDIIPLVLFNTTFFMLLALIALKSYHQRGFLNSVGIKNINMLMVLGICLLIPAALEGYVTPQTDRYIVPFASFAWVIFATSSVIWWRHVNSLFVEGKSKISLRTWQLANFLTVLGSLLILVYFNCQDVIFHSKFPLSAASTLAADMAKGKFKNTAFVFIPDMTLCNIPYYLKHMQSPSPMSIHGGIRWNDATPYSPAQYQELFKNPHLVQELEERISNLPLDKYPKLAFVRENYMPDTKEMPCLQTANALQAWLNKTYKFKGSMEYLGLMEVDSISIFDRTGR